MASLKGPITYRQFINRLRTLEVCIPYFPADEGLSFMVFRWGGDGMYGGRPGGPHHVLIHHHPDFVMPVAEIENCLSHLDSDGGLAQHYWAIREHQGAATESPEEGAVPDSKDRK